MRNLIKLVHNVLFAKVHSLRNAWQSQFFINHFFEVVNAIKQTIKLFYIHDELMFDWNDAFLCQQKETLKKKFFA